MGAEITPLQRETPDHDGQPYHSQAQWPHGPVRDFMDELAVVIMNKPREPLYVEHDRQALIDQAVRACVVVPPIMRLGEYIVFDIDTIRAEFRRLTQQN